MKRVLVIAAIFAQPVQFAFPASGPAALLPASSGKVEFVQPKYDEKAVAISTRMATAVGAGKAPAVSQAEQEYMQARLKSPSLVRVADSELSVELHGDLTHIRIAFPGVSAQPGLPGAASPGTLLVFNPRTGEMTVGRTKLGKPHFNEGKTPLGLAGRYVPGFEWTIKKGTMPAAFVHVGQIPNEPGKCLLNLSVMTEPTSPAIGSYRYACP
jgi:hypothetical protein